MVKFPQNRVKLEIIWGTPRCQELCADYALRIEGHLPRLCILLLRCESD